jgi:hypothetical protein
VQAALHQRLDVSTQRKLDAARGGGVAVWRFFDRYAVDCESGRFRDGRNAFARPDQHGLDETRGACIDRRGQAHRVAGMNDRHLELAERAHVLHQSHEVVALREGDLDLRQRAACALDAFGGCYDRRLAGDHGAAVLVLAAAIEHDPVGRFVARDDGHAYRERVADANRRVECQRLVGILGTGARQPRAKHRRDERSAPHAVRDDAVEACRVREGRVDVRGVDVARHRGEQLDVGSGERALDAGGIADGNLGERAVADDVEVVARKGAGHDGSEDMGGQARM